MYALLVTFYCVCLLLGANCGEQAVQDGISGRLNPTVDGEIARSETDRGAYDEAFVGLPWLAPGKSFEQIPGLALKDLSKAELATLERELSSVVSGPSKAIDSEEKRGLARQGSDRRSSTVSQSRGGRNSRGSGLPSEDRGRQLDGVASPFQSVIESLLEGKEGEQQPRNLPGLFDPKKLLHLPDFLFKNGNSGSIGLPGLPGLPGQPIKRLMEFLREKMLNKQGEANEDRPEDHLFLKRFFQHGRGSLGNVQENL